MAAVLVFSSVTINATGHSYSTAPPPDWKPGTRAWCRVGGPESDNCPGPCIAKNSFQYFRAAETTTWRRGEEQKVTWIRNTHQFGFVRLALVPEKDRMNKKVHDANTFHYACYDSNPQACRVPTLCGTGKTEGTTKFKVPAVPDGKYVLGWAWYGSFAGRGKGKRELFHFGDYWSCSFIRVSGGNVAPVKGKAAFKPELVTGTGEGTCKSMNNKLGVCAVEPCPGAYGSLRPRGMCPAGFKLNGGTCYSPHDDKKTPPVECCDRRRRSRPHVGGIFLIGLDAQGNPKNPRCLCRYTEITEEEYPYGVRIEVFPVGKRENYQNVRFKINSATNNIQRAKPYVLKYKPTKYETQVKIEADLLLNNGAYEGYNIVFVKFKKPTTHHHHQT